MESISVRAEDGARREDWLVYRADGVSLNDPTVLQRERKCEFIFDKLNDQAVRILRSPPGSGKSSLARLLVNSPNPRSCVMVDLCFWDVRATGLDEFWERAVGSSLRCSLDPTAGTPRIFVIDEAQKTFALGRAHPFWEALKCINSLRDRESLVHVFLLGVYCTFAPLGGGSRSATFATPVDIPNGWSLPFLVLDESEVAGLFLAYNVSCAVHLRPEITLALQNTMLHFCGSHVGLLRSAIVRFAAVFRDHIDSLSPSEETAFIREELLILGMAGEMRSLPLLHRLSPGDSYWLKQVTVEGPSALRLRGPIDDDLAELIEVGVFDYDSTSHRVAFSSRLMQTHALQQLFGGLPSYPITVLPHMRAIDVAREVVKRLDGRTLRESLSETATGTLVERQYQMSFFAAAVVSLPQMTVSPDFGFTANSDGYVDFFFDGRMNMGIELTRDGNKLAIHGKRFEAGGTYAPLQLSSWAVVDFRLRVPLNKSVSKHPACLFVCFSGDFAKASLRQHGRPDEDIVIHSLGTNLLWYEGAVGVTAFSDSAAGSGGGRFSHDLPPPPFSGLGKGDGDGGGRRRGASRSRTPRSAGSGEHGAQLAEVSMRAPQALAVPRVRSTRPEHVSNFDLVRSTATADTAHLPVQTGPGTMLSYNAHWTGVALEANRALYRMVRGAAAAATASDSFISGRGSSE